MTFLKRINEHALNYNDFRDTTAGNYVTVLDLDDLELCLLTDEGKAPYLQFQGRRA